MIDNTDNNIHELYPNTVTTTSDIDTIVQNLEATKRLPDAWQKGMEILKEFGVAVTLESNRDYRTIKLFPDRGSDLFSNAQCRKELDMERVRDYTERFNNGEEKRLPSIGVPFDEGVVWVFGNTTGTAMVESTNPHGLYMEVDADLSYEVKRELVRRLANVSNVEDQYHADPDKFEDLPGQLEDQWRGVLDIDLSIPCPHHALENNYDWKRRWHAAKTDPARDLIHTAFTKWWIRKTKGENSKWLTPTCWGKIKAEVFGKKGTGKICGDEWSASDLTEKFNNIFPATGRPEWDADNYNISQSGQDRIWQILHSWGTSSDKHVGNCIGNLKTKILTRIFEEDRWSVFSSVHVIVEGSTGITTMKARKKHINIALKDAKNFNLREGRAVGVPLLEIFLFPQMIRGANVDDYDHAYIWNKGTQGFQEISIERKKKIIKKVIERLVDEKKCCKCHEVLPWAAFNRCAPPNSKDGLQPACRACAQTYQSQQSKTKAIIKENT